MRKHRQLIFDEIHGERSKQVDRKNYTIDHDLDHVSNDWLAIIIKQAQPLCFADSSEQQRQALIKIAATAIAAIEAIDHDAALRGLMPDMCLFRGNEQ